MKDQRLIVCDTELGQERLHQRQRGTLRPFARSRSGHTVTRGRYTERYGRVLPFALALLLTSHALTEASQTGSKAKQGL